MSMHVDGIMTCGGKGSSKKGNYIIHWSNFSPKDGGIFILIFEKKKNIAYFRKDLVKTCIS